MFDYDANSANDLLGFNVIPLALIKSGVSDLWLKVQPEGRRKKVGEEMLEVSSTPPGAPACPARVTAAVPACAGYIETKLESRSAAHPDHIRR